LIRRLLAGLRGDPSAAGLLPPGGRAALPLGLAAATVGFFAVLVLALALAAGRLAATWEGEVADSATLQVIAPGDQIEGQARAALNVLRATPGVRSVRMVDLAEQERLLEPWLGPDIPLANLPLPLLIEVSTDRDELDVAGLVTKLGAEAPGAVFDDHTGWRLPLVASAQRLQQFAALSLALLAVLLGAVLWLVAQASVAANRRVVGVLRLVGARDGFIAGVFTRRLAITAAIGAAVGTALAMLALARMPQEAEAGFLLIGIAPAGWGWAAPLLVPPAAAAVAWLAGRSAALGSIRRSG
jgi:cell division transport system permease protein